MLNLIAEAKKLEVKALRGSINKDTIRLRGKSIDPVGIFRGEAGRVKIIAEIKKASPSKGVLCSNFDPCQLASSYALNGASVISVITDSEFFQGRKEYLPMVKQEIDLPVLRKDFIIDAIQLYESLQLGADLVLLIAALHDYNTLLNLSEKSRELGIEPLVEVHDARELKMVLDLPVRIIGINNRNLKDFTVDINTSLNLVEMIPDSIIKVSESGIKSAQDLSLLEKHGFDAALMGEVLVSSPEPGQKLQELASYREMMNCDPS